MDPKQTKDILKDLNNNRPTQNRTSLIAVVLILISGLVVYANSMNGELIYDDQVLIKDNLYIRNWCNLPKIFTKNVAGGAGQNSRFWRPLQTFTYMVDYYLWRLEAKGYHLTNTLLHISVALAIYWLINILYQDKLLSLFGSLIFVIHPIHTDAVAYISGRADSLSAIFMLLCLIFYIKQLHFKCLSFYILMILCYILALLSKEYALILPLLLLLYHYSFKKKFAAKEFLTLSGIAFIYLLSRATILKFMLPDIGSHPTTVLQRIPGFFAALTNYLRLMILPFGLHIVYGNGLFSFKDPRTVSGIIILLVFLTYGVWAKNRNRLVFFSISWFFITILPVSNLYPINAYMAEHWLYIPSIGFFLILADGLRRIYRNRNSRILGLAVLISLSFFYSYLTIRQNGYWQKAIPFYQRTLRYAPGNAVLYNNLGFAYQAAGDHKKAIAMCEKALTLEPHYPRAYYNLGNIYFSIGRDKEAMASYKKAIELNPDYAMAYCNLGTLYANTGREEEAAEMYKKAIEIQPDFAGAYYNLGITYRDMGEDKKAEQLFKKAAEFNPNFKKR